MEPIFAERIDDVPELLSALVQDGDVIVTQGAGNVSRSAQDLSTLYLKQGNADMSLESLREGKIAQPSWAGQLGRARGLR